MIKKKESINLVPVKPKRPFSNTAEHKTPNYRLEKKLLQDQSELMDVISNADHSKISPFIKFIWEQHQLASSTAFRWQYCLSSAAKFLSVNNILVRKQA